MWDEEDDDSYYNSAEWEYERYLVLQLWDGECDHCGEATESPHVHHVYGLNHQVYEILCPDCHAETMEMMKLLITEHMIRSAKIAVRLAPGRR